MVRRQLLARLSQSAGLSLLGLRPIETQETSTTKKLKIMMKSAWESDDPTRASFPFIHGLALAQAGHDVPIFLTGEATYLMRKTTADAVMPWSGRRYARRLKRSWRNASPSFLEGLALGPVGSRKRI